MQPRLHRVCARSFSLLAILSSVALFSGAIIHFAVGDRYALLAPIDYAFPYPLILLGSIGLAPWHGLRRARILVAICVILALASGWKWMESWGSRAPLSAEGSSARIIFWNAAGPKHPSPALISTIHEDKPDLMAIVEAGSVSAEACQVYERELPGYAMTPLSGGKLVIARSPITVRETKRLPNRTTIHSFQCDRPLGPTRFVLVDIGANPFYDRKRAIEDVMELAAQHRAEVIMGDFNTPYDSRHFDSYR